MLQPVFQHPQAVAAPDGFAVNDEIGHAEHAPGNGRVHCVFQRLFGDRRFDRREQFTPINAQRNAEKPGVVIEIKNGQLTMKQRVGMKPGAAATTPARP